MTDEQRSELAGIIRGKASELASRIESLERTVKPIEPDNAIGRLTRMEAISARGVSEASLNAARSELDSLESALARIDDPDFGACSNCGEPIAFGRLKLMPGTTRCVNCAA